jgi:TPR repeat protein
LWRRKSTDGWADVNRGTAANYCSDAAARDTQAKANSQPDRGGQGAPQDYAQAASFRAAAEQGDAVAQNNLGIAYDLGHGAPQDDAQAAVWFRKAAEQGDAVAQNNLGVLYETGHGVPQDYAQAAVWYRKAAEQGYAIAQYTLGICYLHGQGVPQDNAQEAIWLRKAAEQGYANAQFYLGIAYGLGHGVPEDDAEAYFWIDLGTAGKIEGVKQEDIDRARNDAASLLTPANLSLVQERVKKWLEDHPAKP